MIENSKKPIPVLVSGALGRMGSEVVNTVLNSTDCELVAAIDINEKNNGSNISELLKVKDCDVFVSNDFEGTLCSVSQNYRNEKSNLCWLILLILILYMKIPDQLLHMGYHQ